jgi:cell division protein FtsB
MKTITFKIGVLAVFLVLFSCSSDKKTQLVKLKEQQTAIAEKIKLLETEIRQRTRKWLMLMNLNLLV